MIQRTPPSEPAVRASAITTIRRTALAVVPCLLGMMLWTAPPAVLAANPAAQNNGQKNAAKPNQPPPHKNLNRQDKKWMAAAHQINLAEMKLARLAERRAHANAVIEVAQTLARDHAMLDAKGAKLAHKLGLSLPMSPTTEQQAIFSLVSSKQNMAFDPEWVHQEISAHIGAIEKTKREIHKGSSKQVMHLAKQALPVLKKHLHLLRLAANRMNGGG